jgi:hypothetical protein
LFSHHVLPSHRLNISNDIGIPVVELLLFYPTIARVIRRSDQAKVAPELPHQRGHVTGAGCDVLLDIKRLKYTVAQRRSAAP